MMSESSTGLWHGRCCLFRPGGTSAHCIPLGRHPGGTDGAHEPGRLTMGDASHVAAILLLFGAATADAQVTPPTNTAGAYQKMSPGNQKVARALFEAQTAPTTTTTKTGSARTATAST